MSYKYNLLLFTFSISGFWKLFFQKHMNFGEMLVIESDLPIARRP